MPGDGAAGEGDNVGLDIENATGGSAGDRIVGSAGANELRGALGNDSVDGGGGPDIVRTGDGNDEATGGAGDDSVTGGLGNDELEPQGADSSGNDSLDGGEGDDTIRAGTGPNGIDLFIGGTGRDRASFSERRAPLNINLNGQPDDGEQGEGDNIGADVENATGGSANDRMAGSAAANSFSAGGGEDTVDGGAGDDSLDGDAGEDYIDDTLGEDHLIGGDNGDVLRTRDGNRDELDCNAGTDFAVADTRDTADSDCDRVDRDTRHRPVLGSSMVVTPSGGSLGMAPTGITRVVPLKNVVNLPVRSVVDSTAGTIKITSAQRRSRRGRSSQLVRATTASMRFSEAIFQIRQIRASRPATEIRLRGGDFASCSSTAGASGARAAQNRRVIRRLFSRGRGRFRTRGRYSAATVRGTSWVTQDRCDGTLTTVRSGRVAVFDFARRRTVVVRAGRSYLARAARAQIRGG
jgi:Ca2+-binding RTX toxin-like protein